MRNWYGYAKLARLGTTTSAVLLALVSGYVSADGEPNWWRLVLASLSVGLILAGTNTINDVFDRYIDQVNKPNRPIPLGVVSTDNAIIQWFMLSCFGVLIPIYLQSLPLTTLALCAIVLSAAYAIWLQKIVLVKNLTVSVLTALTVIYAPISTNALKDLSFSLIAVVFFCITAREILKDMADRMGDKEYSRKTLPVMYGLHVAKVAFSLFLGASIVGLFYTTHYFNTAYAVIVLGLVCPLMLVFTWMVLKTKDGVRFEQLSVLLKWSFLLWFGVLVLGL